MDLNRKFEKFEKIMSDNGIKSDNQNVVVVKEKKNDGLFELDNSKRIVMVDNNRQVLTEWK